MTGTDEGWVLCARNADMIHISEGNKKKNRSAVGFHTFSFTFVTKTSKHFDPHRWENKQTNKQTKNFPTS